MTTQSEIDAIDATKPAGTGVPRTAPIRQNFGHIKAALQLLLEALDGVLAASPGPTGLPTTLPMVFDGPNPDIVYWDGTALVPHFVVNDDGNFYFLEI